MKTKRIQGWLVYGVICGAALGYAIVDLDAARWGYVAVSERYGSRALNYTVWGAIAGVFAGVVAEHVLRQFERASRVAWLILGFLIGAYLLIRPSLQMARE